MIAGDGNAEGQVNINDKDNDWGTQTRESGYMSGDFNMNGQVDIVDKNDKLVPKEGKGLEVYNCSVNNKLKNKMALV